MIDAHAQFEALARGLGGCGCVERLGRAGDGWRYDEVDAVHVTIPMAERWGAKPLIGVAQILPVTRADRDDGLPPFVIAGLATPIDSPLQGEKATTAIVDALIAAVHAFNMANKSGIKRVAVLPDHLGSAQIGYERLGQLLRQAVCPS